MDKTQDLLVIKITKVQRTKGVDQVLEHLPSQCQDWSSNHQNVHT
jgi:hypothetical protein